MLSVSIMVCSTVHWGCGTIFTERGFSHCTRCTQKWRERGSILYLGMAQEFWDFANFVCPVCIHCIQTFIEKQKKTKKTLYIILYIINVTWYTPSKGKTCSLSIRNYMCLCAVSPVASCSHGQVVRLTFCESVRIPLNVLFFFPS